MLIRCGGCEALYLSRLTVCPGCGRCPGCGKPRFDAAALAVPGECPACDTPHCGGCGLCHACGTVRALDLGPCSCGYPADPARVAAVEKSFGYRHSHRSFC